MSGTEVTTLRKPGDLIFSTDNEIMTVGVKANVDLSTIGKVVTFDANNFAQLATPTNLDVSKGIGVVIHEGADNTGGSDGDKLVQIATGNAYVAGSAGGVIHPFKNVTVNTTSDFVELVLGNAPAVATLGNVGAAVTALHNFLKRVVGRSYGNPGEMVSPTNVTNNNAVVVRLGKD